MSVLAGPCDMGQASTHRPGESRQSPCQSFRPSNGDVGRQGHSRLLEEALPGDQVR